MSLASYQNPKYSCFDYIIGCFPWLLFIVFYATIVLYFVIFYVLWENEHTEIFSILYLIFAILPFPVFMFLCYVSSDKSTNYKRMLSVKVESEIKTTRLSS